MKSPTIREEAAPEHRHAEDQACIYRAFSVDRGHYLHVSINRNGKLFQKYFPEKRCGGEHNMMKLAQAWRHTIIAKHPPMSLTAFCSILRSNNTSGVAGISRTIKRNRAKSGRVSEIAYWKSRIPMADGRFHLRYFSVVKFSEEGAKELAIEARMQGLSALDNTAFRAKQQPKPVSTVADIALLEASLRFPAERRARLFAEQKAKREQFIQRAAAKLALALAAEEEALERAAKRSGEQYIARYAARNSTTFNWRVSFRRQGTHYRKCFSDSVYGGAAAALLAAKGWRDLLLCTMPAASKAAFVARVKANNTSGVAGVSRKHEVRAGENLDWWVAYSPKMTGMPGRSKAYSIEEFGEEQAFALAVKAREQFVAELGEVEFLQHPAARLMKRALLIK